MPSHILPYTHFSAGWPPPPSLPPSPLCTATTSPHLSSMGTFETEGWAGVGLVWHGLHFAHLHCTIFLHTALPAALHLHFLHKHCLPHLPALPAALPACLPYHTPSCLPPPASVCVLCLHLPTFPTTCTILHLPIPTSLQITCLLLPATPFPTTFLHTTLHPHTHDCITTCHTCLLTLPHTPPLHALPFYLPHATTTTWDRWTGQGWRTGLIWFLPMPAVYTPLHTRSWSGDHSLFVFFFCFSASPTFFLCSSYLALTFLIPLTLLLFLICSFHSDHSGSLRILPLLSIQISNT